MLICNLKELEMDKKIKTNMELLRKIYQGIGDEKVAFTCVPRRTLRTFPGKGDYTLTDEPVTELISTEISRYYEWVKLAEKLSDATVPSASMVTGTHVFAVAFGAEVHLQPGNYVPFAMPFINAPETISKLEVPDIWKSPVLYRIFEYGDALRKELGKDVPLAPPDIQTGFDIACLIMDKQELFCAMMREETKDAVKELCTKCSKLLINFLQELRKEFPTMHPCHCPTSWAPPEMGPWFSNDECGSLSPAMFEEFCLPEIIELSKTFGGFGMHCCADAEHQFKLFEQIPGFYAFNRVPGQSRKNGHGFDPLFESFSPDLAPVFVLSGDEKLAKTLSPQIQDGFRFIFCRNINL